MKRPGFQSVFLVAAALGAALSLPAVAGAAGAPVRPSQTAQLASRRVVAWSGGPFAPTAQPSLDGSPVEELILTSDALVPAFERLAAWKTAKGVPTVVRSVTVAAGAGLQGSDAAETLRLYIRAAYQDWGVRFVLLGGDTDIIPPRYVTSEFQGLANPATDLYYACLDGDWNADGDGNYGEAFLNPGDPGDDADLIAEVYLGRAPVSTPAEANLFVDKILEYERPTVTDFQAKFLLLAEVLFPAAWSPGQPVSIDGATFAENLRLTVLPPAMQVTRLYENLAPYPGALPLTRQASRDQVDAGHGTVVHMGHGYRYSLSVGDGSLDVGDAAAFANGLRAGLVYMLNCTAAAYDFESFAEAMLLNPNGGAALVIGAAREAFPLAAADYQLAFFKHVYERGERRVGEAMTRSRQEFVDSSALNGVDRWTQLTYTLLGDPETPLWSAAQRPLTPGLPANVPIGGQTLDVTVQDGSGPVRGALVCASKTGEVYAVARTDSLGHASLRVEPKTAGSLHFTITAADHLPATADRNVVVPTRGLVVSAAGLSDDGGSSGAGNSDGRLDAGETARLSLPVRNAGNSGAASSVAVLSTSDPDVEVLAGASTYPALAAGAQADAVTPFQIRIRAGTPDSRTVKLSLQLTHDATVETRRVDLEVHAARPRLVALRIDDHRAGDGDGIQDPGEEIDLYYRIENPGSGTAQQVVVGLVALDAGLEVLAGSASFAPLAPGASAESTTPLTVREMVLDAPHRGRLLLTHFQDPAGASRRIDLRPPAALAAPRFVATDHVDAVHVEWTPAEDADFLGYHVERAPAAGGAFVRADADLLRSAYLRDEGLQPSTRYQYRIVAVDSTLLPAAPGPAALVSTNPAPVAGWPQSLSQRSASSVGVGDVDADGTLDVVGGADQIFAWNGHGAELLDADHNPLTYGLFYGGTEAFGSITVADLDPVPGKEIVAATWDAVNRYVVVLGKDGQPRPGWPRPLVSAPASYRGSQVAPVVANLDHTGAPEILVAARDGILYGWHADGTEIADGDANPATQGVLLDTHSPFLRSAPAVADLDPARPGDEIVVGGSDGNLFVVDRSGAALPGWPRNYGGYIASGAAIGDLDQNGSLEIVFLEASNRLHAVHLDGGELPGFPVGGISARSQSQVPSPALANLTGDAKLEIVACGNDGLLRVITAAGADAIPGGLQLGALTECSPIVGDLDGDPGLEILQGDEDGVLQAWNMDGSPVDGFPISVRAELRGTPALADLDGDGDTDLVTLTWDGLVRAWDLGIPWIAARNPWPAYRGDAHRTGLYGYAVPTAVAVENPTATAEAGGNRIQWRAQATAGEDPHWRVYRAGPFADEPLGSMTLFAYNRITIGEIRGSGSLEWMDASVEPGAWYAYLVGWSLEAGREEQFTGPVTLRAGAGGASLQILPNRSNPLRPGTPLRFEIPSRVGASSVDVRLELYDARGRRVRRLVQQPLTAGVHAVTWDGRTDSGSMAASGVYVAQLQAAGHAVTRKLTWLR